MDFFDGRVAGPVMLQYKTNANLTPRNVHDVTVLCVPLVNAIHTYLNFSLLLLPFYMPALPLIVNRGTL